jgi:hypothetical protein
MVPARPDRCFATASTRRCRVSCSVFAAAAAVVSAVTGAALATTAAVDFGFEGLINPPIGVFSLSFGAA